MPRPDYDKFFSQYKNNEKYACFNYENDKTWMAYGRLCDMKLTTSWTSFPWVNQSTGVYISIFPIDGTESDLYAYQSRYKKCSELFRLNYRQRTYFRKPSRYISLKRNVEIIGHSILNSYKRSAVKREMLENLDEMSKECHRYKFGETPYVGHITFAKKGNFPKFLWPIEDFQDYILVDFEGYKFYAISGYDRHLRMRFGDYMQLPPENQRIAVHGHSVYVWKR